MLNRNRWTRLPMPNEVIDRVHRMACQEKANRSLVFQNRNRELLPDQDDEDDEDDESYSPSVGDSESEHELLDPVDDADDQSETQGVDTTSTGPELEPITIGDGAPPPAIHTGAEQAGPQEVEHENTIAPEANDPIAEPAQEGDANPRVEAEDPVTHPLAPIPPGTERELRRLEINNEVPRLTQGRTRSQSRQLNLTTIGDPPIPINQMTPFEQELFTRRIKGVHLPASLTTLNHTIMTQYTLAKGLQVFGPPGKEAVFREMQQLHQRKVCEPRKAADLTADQRKASLGYLMFLKQKRSGQIKGRGCADGRKQRLYTGKEEKTSPTVATESVMLTSTIDAKEGRDMATVDIPGAFMHSNQDETIHLRLQGTLADLLVKCDPKLYRKYVVTEKGQRVLYVELVKALYGTLRAALLFWRRLSKKLVDWGFTINPYDWCVANKLIRGSQCTIIWHIDDLKISHVDSTAVDNVISLLHNEFGQEGPLTVTRGLVHDYLGMTLDFKILQKVQIQMFDFIDKMLKDLPADMDGTARTPAAEHLFTVNPTPKPLPEDTAVLFHHNVAKLLFLCKRARPDLQTAVAFLSTRVKSPDDDDYKKLARVMRYLRATAHLPLTLEADNLQVIKWWIDGAFATHPDMQSHTGGMLSLGKGAIYGASTRQKLNTRSSTEAELVGVDDCMPQILWTRYFLEAQGYQVKDSVVYQDNQSAMLLANNGRASSSKRTRHMNIRYFFFTDRIHAGDLRVEYCPTDDMIADFFTKPLQGGKFVRFRDQILNVQSEPDITTISAQRSVLGNEAQADHSQRAAQEDSDACTVQQPRTRRGMGLRCTTQ